MITEAVGEVGLGKRGKGDSIRIKIQVTYATSNLSESLRMSSSWSLCYLTSVGL